jgi:hypothetical protein
MYLNSKVCGLKSLYLNPTQFGHIIIIDYIAFVHEKDWKNVMAQYHS